jgi:hypothetical protein
MEVFAMSEATTNTLLDDLTSSGLQTDHGGMTFADLVVLLLDAVLLVYTAWRSFDFLSTTVPDGWQMLALVGLWGLDIGAIAWSLVWIFGSTGKFQNWISMAFFVIDLVGVALTGLTDSLMYGATGDAMTDALTGVTTVAVPLVLFGNVVAGFIYHMTSPETKRRRSRREADARHKVEMDAITDMELELSRVELRLLARQDMLDKGTVLADIKANQDALEVQTRKILRDRLKIHGLSTSQSEDKQSFSDKVDELRQRLAEATAQLKKDSTAIPELETIPILADRPTLDDTHPQAGANGGHKNSDPQ